MVQDNEQDYFGWLPGGMAWYVSGSFGPRDSMFVYSEIPVNAAGEEDGLILSRLG